MLGCRWFPVWAEQPTFLIKNTQNAGSHSADYKTRKQMYVLYGMYAIQLDAPVNTLYSRQLPRTYSQHCSLYAYCSVLYARCAQPESIPTYIKALCTIQLATHSGTNAAPHTRAIANANAHAIKIIIRIQVERRTMRITNHLRLIQGCGHQLYATTSLTPCRLVYLACLIRLSLPITGCPLCSVAYSTLTHYIR